MPSDRERPRQVEVEHYGWQIFLADMAVTLAIVGAAAMDSDDLSEPIGVAGLGGYLLGGPVVHAVHGKYWTGAGSLALRGALPVLGVWTGAYMEESDCRDDEFLCGLDGAIVGAMVGMGTAAVVDWLLLARKTVETRPAAGISMMPALSLGPDRVSLGLSGRF